MNDGTYRDSSGWTLADYPRPSVAVDTAVLTLDPKLGLVVLEVRRVTGTGWALPGTFLYEGETLAEAVDRSLRDKANVRGLHPRQLHVFDDPHRDDRGWVLSVAHVEVVQAERLESRFVEATRLEDVRTHYLDKPDPDGLLGDEFTLRELRIAHEAIAGQPLQRDTFRRAMEPHLVATGTSSVSGRGRPAELFRRSK